VYQRTKMLPRDRISRLWDEEEEGGMLELGTLAGLGMKYGDVPGAGVIWAIGRIHGVWCIVSANEGTLKGGTYFPIGVQKSRLATEMAHRLRLPLVLLIDSGGAFLPLQSEIFPDAQHGGRMFYLTAVQGGEGMPSVAVVCGSCTAGGAYAPTMCDEAAMVQGTGALFLAGPPLIKAALGEEVSAQDLGGAEVHTKVSGVCDYLSTSEEEALAVVRDCIATTPSPLPHTVVPHQEPLYDVTELDGLSCLTSLGKPETLSIIARLTDGSRFREFKAEYGKHLVAGYANIAGSPVVLLASFGPLTRADALKGSQILQISQHRAMPVIFLQNSGAFEAVPDEEALIARGAMAASVACLDTPTISVCTGQLNGDQNLSMCGPGFSSSFSFAWPSSSIRFSSPPSPPAEEGAKPKKGKGMALPPGSAWHSAAHLLVDDVIAPRTTREVLKKCLNICQQQSRLPPFVPKQFPVLRFQ